MINSIVYLVGAGPGDIKLITVRGMELIRRADCIIYDYLANPKLLEFAKSGCKIIYAGKQAGKHTLSQGGINRLLAKEAKRNSVVVRLKGGDPFVFGRGAEEALYLTERNIVFEIVPGVTSAIAAACYAGIPLTERSRNSTVGFITGNEDPQKETSKIDWSALSDGLGVMVFLMGVRNLERIVNKLILSGKPKSTPVAIITWGTTAKQKTVTGNLGSIVSLAKKNKVIPPSIIVVGETVVLRDKLSWFEKKPLFGKKIIVTRARHQASVLADKLIDLGAEVIEIPTIEIISLRFDNKLSYFLHSKFYSWVFFTSANGVEEFSSFLDRSSLDSRVFKGAKICAIGPQTTESLKKIGIKPDYIPPQFVAESILAHFKERSHGHVLILRAKQARNVLPQGLKKRGFEVDVVDLYDTCLPKENTKLIRDTFKEKIDLITFTSSSTVSNFIKLAGKNYRGLLKGVKIASIGPVTSEAIRKAGLKVTVEAPVYTIDGLVDAIHF